MPIISVTVLILFQRSILRAWKNVKFVSTVSQFRKIIGVSYNLAIFVVQESTIGEEVFLSWSANNPLQ